MLLGVWVGLEKDLFVMLVKVGFLVLFKSFTDYRTIVKLYAEVGNYQPSHGAIW